MKTKRLVDYNELPGEPTANGDIFPYGRHKKKENEMMVKYMDKLRLKKLEVRNAPITVLSPEAIEADKNAGKLVEVIKSKPHHRISKEKYRELQRKFEAKLHK